MVVVKAMHRK